MGETIETVVGASFDIALEATPTAGYRWEPVDLDDAVELLGDDVESPSGLGGSARQVFHFRALRAGQARVILRYGRPWEAQEADRRRYTVRVRSG